MVVTSMQHHTHQQQGPVPPHLQHSRPPSIVHQPHHSQSQAQQQPQQQPQQPQHSGAYPSGHSVYQQQSQASNSQEHGLSYYAHPSPYSTPGATSGYTSAGMFSVPLRVPRRMDELTRYRRDRRHDGCHNAEALPPNVLSYPPVELARISGVAVGS